MYAVIKTGGKQYRVTKGENVTIEKLSAEVGSEVAFNEVLWVSDGDRHHIGTPLLANAKVMAQVVAPARGPKIEIIKLKRRKHHLKHQGHRQHYTVIKISDILVGK